MKLLFVLLPLLYTGANAYLFIRCLQAMIAWPLWMKILVSILFWILAFALFVAIGLRESSLPDALLRSLYLGGSVWLVFLLYSVLSLCLLDLLKLAIPTMAPTICYALPIVCLLMLYGYIHYQHPKVEHIEIASQQASLKKDIRVVAVSDIHLGYGTGLAKLEKFVTLINRQQADMLLICGDLIDNSIKPILREPFQEVLAKIEAPMGVYMVPGNHEYISGIDKVSAYLDKTQIQLLRDSVLMFPQGIRLLGRDDKTNLQRDPLVSLLGQGDTESFTIVLDHQPYGLAQADALGVDLLICGHTHHGQVFPLNWATNCLFEQSHGYRRWEHAHIWVSSGLSLWGPPFRIGTHSDLAVIDIKAFSAE